MKTDKPRIVINTGPTISLIAATGDLKILEQLYSEVHVPFEVVKEITVNNSLQFGADIFTDTKFLIMESKYFEINPMLSNSLDSGEASVIQMALNKRIGLVGIDEIVGRRIARLSGLKLNGSLGMLVKAKKNGLIESVSFCIERMKEKGIYLLIMNLSIKSLLMNWISTFLKKYIRKKPEKDYLYRL